MRIYFFNIYKAHRAGTRESPSIVSQKIPHFLKNFITDGHGRRIFF